MAVGTCDGTSAAGRMDLCCTHSLQEQKAFGGPTNWELALSKLNSLKIGRKGRGGRK